MTDKKRFIGQVKSLLSTGVYVTYYYHIFSAGLCVHQEVANNIATLAVNLIIEMSGGFLVSLLLPASVA